MTKKTICGSHENDLVQDATLVRVQSCLYGYCPQRTKDCERCDAVIAALGKIPLAGMVAE